MADTKMENTVIAMTKKEAAAYEVKSIDRRIEQYNKIINESMRALELNMNNVYNVITFAPAYIERIKNAEAKIRELAENKELLEYFVLSDEENV